MQAVDSQGNTLTEQWDFQVAGNTGDGYRPDLSVTNMTSGQNVHETFDIEGPGFREVGKTSRVRRRVTREARVSAAWGQGEAALAGGGVTRIGS